MATSSRIFNAHDADVILQALLGRGSDQFKYFCVHNAISSVALNLRPQGLIDIRDTFSLPQPSQPATGDVSLPTVSVSESAEVFETFLRLGELSCIRAAPLPFLIQGFWRSSLTARSPLTKAIRTIQPADSGLSWCSIISPVLHRGLCTGLFPIHGFFVFAVRVSLFAFDPTLWLCPGPLLSVRQPHGRSPARRIACMAIHVASDHARTALRLIVLRHTHDPLVYNII